MSNEYGYEGFDDEVVDERVAVLLDAWGVEEPEDGEDDGWYRHQVQRAAELAVSFPSEISTDLFAEYVAEGITAIA